MNNKKILVACEESQAVCNALRAKGIEAFSCDLLPCSGGHPEWHILQDVVPLLDGKCSFFTCDGLSHTVVGKWDMIIAFPPCTYLTNAGNRHFSERCNSAEKIDARMRQREIAANFFLRIVHADCEHIAIENPVGCMNKVYRQPDQIIHPYYFASSVFDVDNYHSKRTCLWLKGLPLLERFTFLDKPKPMYYSQGIKTFGKPVYWCDGIKGVGGGQVGRAIARSKTFPGIAAAMAAQWGDL